MRLKLIPITFFVLLLFLLPVPTVAQGAPEPPRPVAQAPGTATATTPGITSTITSTFPLTGTLPVTFTPGITLTPAITLTPTVTGTVKPSATITATGTVTTTVTAIPILATPQPPLIEVNPRHILSNILVSGLILIAGWLVATVVHKIVSFLLSHVHPDVQIFLARLAYILVWIAAILGILSVFQVQVATLTAIIGTLGLALSLSSQDLAKNFIFF